MIHFTFISQALFTALYFVSAVFYLIYFFRIDRKSGSRASWLMITALAVHLITLTVRIGHLHYLPFATIFDALSFTGFVVGMAYITIEKTSRDISMGAFISPLIVAAEVVSLVFFTPSGSLPALFKSHWFEVHVSCSIFAFASFTIAFIGSILYLILYRELQRKRPGHFYSRLTSLEQLDRVNLFGAVFGLVFLALAIFTGFRWMKDIQAEKLRLDARIVASWFTFFVYLTELLVRRFTRAGGRTLSVLSIAGFVLVMVAFIMEGIVH